jgi:SagB-type dehydrogenase family enzyme
MAPFLTVGTALLLMIPLSCAAQEGTGGSEMIRLPEINNDGDVSVERAMTERRSIRSFAADAVSLPALSQLLWSAQGVTLPMEEPPEGFGWQWMGGLRTAPSAGALYPVELYAVVGVSQELEPGVYRYIPTEHAVEKTAEGDLREALWGAALRQTSITEAPVTLVFAAVVERLAVKYGDRSERYALIEVGAAAENVFLQCESLDLGTVLIGAFQDDQVADVLGLPADQHVYAIMPVGQVSSDARD